MVVHADDGAVLQAEVDLLENESRFVLDRQLAVFGVASRCALQVSHFIAQSLVLHNTVRKVHAEQRPRLSLLDHGVEAMENLQVEALQRDRLDVIVAPLELDQVHLAQKLLGKHICNHIDFLALNIRGGDSFLEREEDARGLFAVISLQLAVVGVFDSDDVDTIKLPSLAKYVVELIDVLDQSHASALRVFLLDIRVELDQVTVDELRLQFDCKHVRVDDGSGTNLASRFRCTHFVLS
mmetsp:Transcript_33804/g.66503  ORF Transcript_33804/g.66503 Transcript_33804/m.66503 type:complete len:238 (+) Transcript_33804:1973-2686(+)